MTSPPYTDVGLRLALDLAAIAVLAYGLFYRRHRRRELFVVYAMFNVGLFVALVVISAGEVGIGVGFGLFAVLSIIRLRSEPFSHAEIGYFFVSLVIALVCGIDLGSLPFAAALCGVALAATAVLDHPRLLAQARSLEVVLELVFADEATLRRHLEERLDGNVVDLAVLEVDYVRETTRARVRYLPCPRSAAGRPSPEPLHAIASHR